MSTGLCGSRFFLPGNFRKQLCTVKIDFIATDLSRLIELDKTYADDFQSCRSNWNDGFPLVQEPVFHGNTFYVCPGPVGIVSKKLCEISQQRGLALHPRGNARIKIEGVFRIEAGQQFRIVSGPGGEPLFRELACFWSLS